jgi:hypothetical protein
VSLSSEKRQRVLAKIFGDSYNNAILPAFFDIPGRYMHSSVNPTL